VTGVPTDRSGVNPALTSGELQWVDSNTTAWQLPVTGIRVGDGGIELNATAVISSVSDHIFFSRAIADSFVRSVPGARDFSITVDPVNITYELIVVPCNTSASLTFSFGGVDVAVPPANWIKSEKVSQSLLQGDMTPDSQLEPGECAANVLPPQSTDGEGQPELQLGLAFLSSIYTVFKYGDRPQVGFASLTDAARGVIPQHVEGNATATATIPGYSAVAASPGADKNSAAGATGVTMLAVLAAVAAYVL
jgi:cathepsin D